MIFEFIAAHQAKWPVTVACEALGVSTAGYYAWCRRQTSDQQQRRDRLVVQMRVIHETVRHRYGSPRRHAELVDRGHNCCVNTVARIMREAGIAAKTKRKFRHTTDSNHDRPVAPNVLDRQFEPTSGSRTASRSCP